jgi:hypothetical protein
MSRMTLSTENVPMRIADEVGSIFRQHDALAELRVAEVSDSGFDQRGVCVGGGDQLQQAHVARRIEKMRAEPGPAEIFGKAFSDFGYRKPAGVGGDDGAGLADGINLL